MDNHATTNPYLSCKIIDINFLQNIFSIRTGGVRVHWYIGILQYTKKLYSIAFQKNISMFLDMKQISIFI